MITVSRLSKTCPDGTEAVRAVDFDVAPGEVFGLLGPNGAGKSTTIGMLTTTIRPTGGTARLAGFDVAEKPLAARRVSSVVFQEPVVDRSLTGRRNLELHAQLWRVDAREAEPRIAELAAALGVAALLDRAVGSYSGGERRRLDADPPPPRPQRRRRDRCDRRHRSDRQLDQHPPPHPRRRLPAPDRRPARRGRLTTRKENQHVRPRPHRHTRPPALRIDDAHTARAARP